jgi:hypothetical protein
MPRGVEAERQQSCSRFFSYLGNFLGEQSSKSPRGKKLVVTDSHERQNRCLSVILASGRVKLISIIFVLALIFR